MSNEILDNIEIYFNYMKSRLYAHKSQIIN